MCVCVCVDVYLRIHYAVGTHVVLHLLWAVRPWARTVDSVHCESVTAIDGVGGHALLCRRCFNNFVCTRSRGLEGRQEGVVRQWIGHARA